MSQVLSTGPLSHASLEALFTILETLPTAIFILDEAGTITAANVSAQVLLRASREKIIDQPFAHVLCGPGASGDHEQICTAIAQTRTGETAHLQVTHPFKKETKPNLEVTLTRHVNLEEHCTYFVVAVIENAEHNGTDDGIATLIDAIPHFVWIMDPDGSARYGNQRWCDYTGKAPEQVQGEGWLQFIHPEDRPGVQEAWQTAVRTGTLYEVEHRIKEGHTGEYRWFLARSLPQRDMQGNIIRWMGTCTDIDAQKRAEARVKESEQHWHTLAETLPQLVWTIRAADGLSDYFNQRFCDYTQATQAQLYGYGWSQFVHPEDRERTLMARTHALREGSPYEITYRLREGCTGCYRWFLARAMPIRDETGQIFTWFGSATDIDEQKQAEEALRHSQARLRALIDSNIIGIVSLEVDGEVITEANDAWLHMTGYSREEVQSRSVTRERMTPPEQAPAFDRAIQEVILCGQHTPIETEVICRDGNRLPVLLGGVSFQEYPRQMISFMLDNSARKELEQRKDTFISMASHELRNPLTALKMQIQLARKRLEKQGLVTAAVTFSAVEGPVRQLERLIGELLDVSKIRAGKLEYTREPLDLAVLLQKVAEFMHQVSPSHTILLRGAAPSHLIGDPGRLEQVFANLISNAIKYSPGAHAVEVDVGFSEEIVTICIHDHGLGISQEQRDKIFERFYRVDDPRRKAISGLGMGLYIVAEIIKGHGGTISVESEVGIGSTFRVTLPLHQKG